MKNIFKKNINTTEKKNTEKKNTEKKNTEKKNIIENNTLDENIEEHWDFEFKPTAESMMGMFDEAKKDFADRLHVAANTFGRDLRKTGLYLLVGEDYEKLKEAHKELIKVLFDMEEHLAEQLNKGND